MNFDQVRPGTPFTFAGAKCVFVRIAHDNPNWKNCVVVLLTGDFTHISLIAGNEWHTRNDYVPADFKFMPPDEIIYGESKKSKKNCGTSSLLTGNGIEPDEQRYYEMMYD